MLKVIHLEIKGCHQCPFVDQGHDGIDCIKVEPSQELLSATEAYKVRMTITQKFGKPFPPFCPLPDKN
jgi:hypothetical protein